MKTETIEFAPITERVSKLLDSLKKRALANRSAEWFSESDFEASQETVFEEAGISNEDDFFELPVIQRKAYAIDIMLRSMTDERVNKHTHTYEIENGELIVGVMPMASNGLGKVFPNYMSEDEKRAASYTNKTELAILGHNTVNYERLLSKGIRGILQDADGKLKKLEEELKSYKKDRGFKKFAMKLETISITQSSENVKELMKYNDLVSKIEFYKSVKISCNAVVGYAERFAELAEKLSVSETSRSAELQEIARICRKVPMEKPETFHEALQSVYFFHLAMHASMNLISLGRLDQSLNEFLQRDLKKCKSKEEKEAARKKAIELFECFIIKCAGRLNLTTEFLLEQDHMDNNAALGVHPYYLDQRAGVNNFLQNIIIGGLTPDGKNAENEMTFVIINAFANVNLSTPGIYVRMGENSSDKLKAAVAKCLHQTKNLPGILNDDVLVPAIGDVLKKYETDKKGRDKAQKLANDYCVDGCWEPILNGECDWTFQMVGCLNMFQCAINQGAVLDTNDGMLRGNKLSFRSPQVRTYKEFKDSFVKYMQFFIDQATFTMFDCYTMDEFVTPSPLFSAVLGKCMERGRDKSWGGTGMNIAGIILTGVPDVINLIAAFKKFVFGNSKYDIEDVKNAMVHNFKVPGDDFQCQLRWNQMKNDFDYNCAKFGDGSVEIKEIGEFVLNTFVDILDKSGEFSEKVFLNSLKGESPEYINHIRRLRTIAGYNGCCLKRKFGSDFCLRLTAGCGTFEGYPQQGLGVVATTNRGSNEPLIANFSPAPGTIKNGLANVFKTLSQLPMNKMSAGAITDLCISEKDLESSDVESIVDAFLANKGCMMTLAIGDIKMFQRMYDLSKDLLYGNENQKQIAREELPKYRDVVVRVGGWQAPFISMNLDQQANYIARFVSKFSAEKN